MINKLIYKLSEPFFGSIWLIRDKKYYNVLFDSSYITFPSSVPSKYKPKLPTNLNELLIYDSVDHNATLDEFIKIYKNNTFYKADINIKDTFNAHISKMKEEYLILYDDTINNPCIMELLSGMKFNDDLFYEIHSHNHLLVYKDILENKIKEYLINENVALISYDAVIKKEGERNELNYKIKKNVINLLNQYKNKGIINKNTKLSSLIKEYSFFDELIFRNKYMVIEAFNEVMQEESKSEGEI